MCPGSLHVKELIWGGFVLHITIDVLPGTARILTPRLVLRILRNLFAKRRVIKERSEGLQFSASCHHLPVSCHHKVRPQPGSWKMSTSTGGIAKWINSGRSSTWFLQHWASTDLIVNM